MGNVKPIMTNEERTVGTCEGTTEGMTFVGKFRASTLGDVFTRIHGFEVHLFSKYRDIAGLVVLEEYPKDGSVDVQNHLGLFRAIALSEFGNKVLQDFGESDVMLYTLAKTFRYQEEGKDVSGTFHLLAAFQNVEDDIFIGVASCDDDPEITGGNA